MPGKKMKDFATPNISLAGRKHVRNAAVTAPQNTALPQQPPPTSMRNVPSERPRGHRASPSCSRKAPAPNENMRLLISESPTVPSVCWHSQPLLFIPRAQMTAYCMKTWRQEQSSMSQSFLKRMISKHLESEGPIESANTTMTLRVRSSGI
jgi:hypothetical protein